jgi:hypothetical protein
MRVDGDCNLQAADLWFSYRFPADSCAPANAVILRAAAQTVMMRGIAYESGLAEFDFMLQAMSRVKKLLLPILLGPLVSCAEMPNFNDAATIPVAEVINGLKCELSGFYIEHAQYRIAALQIDPRKLTSIDLTLKVVNGREAGIGGKAGVIPFAGGGLTPSLNFGVKSTETITTTASFTMQQIVTNQLDCKGLKLAATNLGLRKWLTDYFEEQTRIVKGEPGVALAAVVLETSFGVSMSGGARADVVFYPVSATASATAARDDIQSLRIIFRGPYAKDAERPDNGGPVPYFRSVPRRTD